MLTPQDVATAIATAPPVPLDPATVRRLIAARPEDDLSERVASAAYLDALSAPGGCEDALQRPRWPPLGLRA